MKVRDFSPHSTRQTFSPSRSTHCLKCKAVTPEEPGVQMRIIWQGSNRGQFSQTIIWLLVGASQRPGGPANRRRVRPQRPHDPSVLLVPRETLMNWGCSEPFVDSCLWSPNYQFSMVTGIAAILKPVRPLENFLGFRVDTGVAVAVRIGGTLAVPETGCGSMLVFLSTPSSAFTRRPRFVPSLHRGPWPHRVVTRGSSMSDRVSTRIRSQLW